MGRKTLAQEKKEVLSAIKKTEETIKAETQKRNGWSASVKLLRFSVKGFKEDIRRLKDELRQIEEEIKKKKNGGKPS